MTATETLDAIAADCEHYINGESEIDAHDLCVAFLAAINQCDLPKAAPTEASLCSLSKF